MISLEPPPMNLAREFYIGVCVALGAALVLHLACSLYQFGYEMGVHDATQKRPVAENNIVEYPNRAPRGQTSKTGDSNRGKLREDDRAQPEKETP